jgi:hypothetical protein
MRAEPHAGFYTTSRDVTHCGSSEQLQFKMVEGYTHPKYYGVRNQSGRLQELARNILDE